MATKTPTRSDDSIYRIPPYYYLHVLDQNSNVTRVVEGPLTFIRQDNEKVVFGPEKMVTGMRLTVPRHLCPFAQSRSRLQCLPATTALSRTPWLATKVRSTQAAFPASC